MYSDLLDGPTYIPLKENEDKPLEFVNSYRVQGMYRLQSTE